MGEGGPEGGFTEYAAEGYPIVMLPDSHGFHIDWQAAEAALAFVRYYRPKWVILLGDHVDFEAVSRFRKRPDRVLSLADDLAAAQTFLAKVRESAPDARITYLKGNHEARLAHYIWNCAPALHQLKGNDVPTALDLGAWNIEWEESGCVHVNDSLIAKHGHLVRQRSGYTGTGEMERNGVSGVSGHTHRLGQVYKRTRQGIYSWTEAGCLCQYDPEYMEGQVSDWQQGLAFGTVSLKGNGFSLHTAPIVGGRVRVAGREVGP